MTDDARKPLQEWPIERLRNLFSYDPSTGLLRWKFSPRKGVALELVGAPDSNGCLRFEYKGRAYSVHRIAFAVYHGYWAKNQIDHKNRIKNDNRIANLREATAAQNMWNRACAISKSGYRGVCLDDGRYVARISCKGRNYALGSFDDALTAAKAYDAAALKLHEEFATVNGVLDAN